MLRGFRHSNGGGWERFRTTAQRTIVPFYGFYPSRPISAEGENGFYRAGRFLLKEKYVDPERNQDGKSRGNSPGDPVYSAVWGTLEIWASLSGYDRVYFQRFLSA